MSETPPNFAAYPRENPSLEAERLQALADGYFGLNVTFLLNVVLFFAVRAGTIYARRFDFVAGTLVTAVIVGLAIACLSYSPNRKIAFGANWAVAAIRTRRA